MELRKRLPAFKKWLTTHGAEILSPTNEWELLRVKANGVVFILYRNKNERLWATKGLEEIFHKFLEGQPWKAVNPVKGASAKRQYINTLAEKYGLTCCYCDYELTPETATIEHFLAKTHGGPNTIQNMGLACQLCNNTVGSLPVMEKLQYLKNKRTTP